ncbi:hypothetical protein LPB87_20425 [Flavobacterium sp. EDS]|uniref:hypothetical protein n=1 Tax=Flavobacterium sp. EDS TaxID=2897328 RepID=UPI001E3C5ED0|nr:hypothetical protein [Flavobacterium sp. EDS]MCD0476766.1 hypothetical protein [Flavobacterium sp. EDS]
MKKLILILFFAFSLNCHSQTSSTTSSSIERSFILHFIQENVLVIKDKTDKRNVYNPEVINIEIDTLGNYGSDILFCKFKLGKNKIKSMDEKLEIYLKTSSCDEYILAYNIESKEFFRIKGFNGNDLFSLMKSINQSSTEQKSIKKILSELNEINIGVDFTDIYNALKKFNFEADCLKTCSDPKEAHGKIK